MNYEWKQLTALMPEKPGQPVCWEKVSGTVLSGHASAMADTPQEPEHHGEGDVWKHTKLVCERLIELEEFWKLGKPQRTELFVAALLHDIGKPKTTKIQGGKISSPHHGEAGMLIARQLLWTSCDLAGTPESQRIRETICMLIRYHTAPVNALKRENPALFLRKIAANGALVPDFTLHMLCLLSEADVRGRIADDTEEWLNLIRLCREQAEESGCLNGPYDFPDEHTAYAYLSGKEISPEYPLCDDTWGEVVMVCGFPGTGKDTWISRNLPGMPVLSLDDIRREMKIKPADDEGRIIQEGKKRAKAMLAAHQPFVFNGTNVTNMIRGKWERLFEQCYARLRLVWLETGWQENLSRNAEREYAVPESVIAELLEKAELPESAEAQRVEWVTLQTAGC